MQDSPQVQAIQARYKASFNDKAAMLNDFLSQIQAHLGDADLIARFSQELHEELHKLAGSLGMYGYDDFALLARDGMRHTKDNDIDAVQRSVQQLISHLQSSANTDN